MGTVIYLMVASITQNSEYDGYWITDGYGMYLDIKNGKVTSYQISNETILKSPLLNGRIRNGVLRSYLSNYNIIKQTEVLFFEDQVSGHVFKAHSIDRSPQELKDERQKDNPYYNFQVFWDSFNEYYAFFDLYGVDWKEQYDKYYPKITKDLRNDELMTILVEMIEDLNDDHVSIEYNDEELSPYKDKPKWLKGSSIKELVEVVDQQYVKHMTYLLKRRIRYGWLNERIAYMNLALMASDINQNNSLEALIPNFEKALKELQHSQTLVLDLRFNQGGHDAVSLAYASYFADQKRLVFRKHGRNKEKYTELVNKYIEPNGRVFYEGNIVILTSGATVSAAEIFLLAMEQLPNVKIVGEETAGFYSDTLPRILPNGATFNLSSERYYTPEGQLLEGKGIQPAVHIAIDLSAQQQGKDPALDWILENYR